jgi:hypothetical protein
MLMALILRGVPSSFTIPATEPAVAASTDSVAEPVDAMSSPEPTVLCVRFPQPLTESAKAIMAKATIFMSLFSLPPQFNL